MQRHLTKIFVSLRFWKVLRKSLFFCPHTQHLHALPYHIVDVLIHVHPSIPYSLTKAENCQYPGNDDYASNSALPDLDVLSLPIYLAFEVECNFLTLLV